MSNPGETAKQLVEVVKFKNHKMIDLVEFAKNEPELFDEIANDYPAEKSVYVYCRAE